MEADGAVRAPLAAHHFDAESCGQRRRRRTWPRHVGAGQIVGQRRGVDFRVARAVILLLAPGLGRQIQLINGETGFAFQHRHQTSFDPAPEGLLFSVLVRRIRQRRLVQHAQSGQAGSGFLGQHGGAVVGHQGARQAALHEGLAQAVDQTLGRFIEIPLQMADQARAVVDHAHQHRRHPDTLTREHLARAMMEIEMPQRAHMVDFEAAHFKPLQPIARGKGAGSGALGLGLAEHALRFQIAPDGRIGG